MSDVRICSVPGCGKPCHVPPSGAVRTKCIEHLRQRERERAAHGLTEVERHRRAAMGILMDYPGGAAVSNAHCNPEAPTVAPMTAKSLVRAGLAALDPEQNRITATDAGRQWWLRLMNAPPARALKSDCDYVAPAYEDIPERSTLAAAARALPPLPPAPPLKLAEELALLAELKARLRQVDIVALASVPQVAPLVPVLQMLERAG